MRPPPGRSGSGDPWRPEPRTSRASWRQNEELGKPERPQQRTQQRIVCSIENFAKVKRKGTIRGLRYVGKSHVACLLIMFFQGRLAMPSMGHENVRHATLLFCAEGVNVRVTGAGEKRIENE